MNTAGIGLKEPERTDWDNYNPGSKFVPPPPALGPDGKAIVYYGQAPQFKKLADGTLEGEEATDEGYLQVVVDPIRIVKSGPGADGYEIRFTRINVRQFEKNGKKLNAHTMGNYLRACGLTAKPQTNAEYRGAVLATSGRVFPFTIDWVARNKDTGEEVRGYQNFPDDPDRPGQKKAILKAGDQYTDKDGNVRTVQSEVLFANAKVRYYIDPNKK